MLKDKIYRSEKHRRFVADLPCCMCESPDVQAAHIRHQTGGGMGLKPGDNWCIPLCVACHGEQHRVGELKFFPDIDRAKWLALKLFERTGDSAIGNMAITVFNNGVLRERGSS